MIKSLKRQALLAAVLLAAAGPWAAAQDQAPPDDSDYAFGTVESIQGEQVTVNEYDYDNDKDVTVTYDVDPRVELTNAGSLKDIAKGDSVDITFIERDGRRRAVAILVEKLTVLQEEATPIDPSEDEE